MRYFIKLYEDASHNNDQSQKNLSLWNAFTDAIMSQVNIPDSEVIAETRGGKNREYPTRYILTIKKDPKAEIFEKSVVIKFDIASEAFEIKLVNEDPRHYGTINEKGTGFDNMIKTLDNEFWDVMALGGFDGPKAVISSFSLNNIKTESFAEEFNLFENMWDQELPNNEPQETKQEEEPDADFMQLIATPEGIAELLDYHTEYRLKIHKIASQADPKALSETIDKLVNKLLNEHEDFELEYSGFEKDWHEDHFDPTSLYGHYDTGYTAQYDDFTYRKDAVSIFELIRDTILPKYMDDPKYKNYSVVSDYAELEEAYDKATSEEEQQIIIDEQELLLAAELADFYDIFEKVIISEYENDAYEWAEDNISDLTEIDPRDYWED